MKPHGLFANLKNIKTRKQKLSNIIFSVFDGSNNYMKSGYELRKVINYLMDLISKIQKINNYLELFMSRFY